MAKKYNYLCLWLFFFPAAHFYETFWPRKIWPPLNKKVWVSGSRNCQNTSSNWEWKKKARKNCCQKHSRFGGRKSGSQWPFLTISASFLTWYIFIDSLIKPHENGDEKWLGDIWPTFSRFSSLTGDAVNRVSDYAFWDVSVSPCLPSILQSEWSRNLTIILTALFLSKAFREVPDKDHRFSVLNI